MRNKGRKQCISKIFALDDKVQMLIKGTEKQQKLFQILSEPKWVWAYLESHPLKKKNAAS